MINELNKEQQAAAEFLNGNAVVLAVPGSGKTRTLMERICILVNQHRISPENILGLTFTKNAANEMRTRLEPILGDLSARVHLSTIHSFCYWLLKSEGKVFDILTGKDQIVFLKDIMKKLNIKDLSTGMVLREISLAKNNLITLDEFRVLYEGDKTMLRIADVYEEYEKAKEKKCLLDFDDLICETYSTLKQNEEVRNKWQMKCAHMLVDEFQDTNPAQIEILKLLLNHHDNDSSFWVCGDDWQSIYGFTGASVGNILNFQETFQNAERFILNMNYRSTPQILEACQNLIRHNVKRIDKTLVTENAPGEDVIVLEASSEEGEALNIVNEVNELMQRDDISHNDLCVLFRCNFQSRVIEEAFCQHKIPYYIENELNFYQRKEVANLLDYLRLISEPQSDKGDEALKSILNVPNRYISRKFVYELETYTQKKELHLYEALKVIPIALVYIRKNVKKMVELLDALMEISDELEPAELIRDLRVSLDYDRFVTDDDIPSPDDVKIANLDQLQMAATRFRSIKAFLDYADSFEDELVSDNKDGVKLMTIHKCKGLQFRVVFLIGLVENLLPSSRGDLEEERRIAFVACSRAMELLYLSYSHTYLGQSAKRSIFLDEILGNIEPPDLDPAA
jgi:DNA helicase-2/ATP-dependent DNA helicase PcrA